MRKFQAVGGGGEGRKVALANCRCAEVKFNLSVRIEEARRQSVQFPTEPSIGSDDDEVSLAKEDRSILVHSYIGVQRSSAKGSFISSRLLVGSAAGEVAMGDGTNFSHIDISFQHRNNSKETIMAFGIRPPNPKGLF